MARPAPDTPRGGNDYGGNDGPEGERIVALAGRRSPSKPADAGSRQSQRQADGPPQEQPEDIPWKDDISWNDDDMQPPVMTEDTPPHPERQGQADARRAIKKAGAAADPVAQAKRQDHTEHLPISSAPASLNAPAPTDDVRPAPRPREYDVAGTIYLIVLAIIAASLSAAVVLFLF